MGQPPTFFKNNNERKQYKKLALNAYPPNRPSLKKRGLALCSVFALSLMCACAWLAPF